MCYLANKQLSLLIIFSFLFLNQSWKYCSGTSLKLHIGSFFISCWSVLVEAMQMQLSCFTSSIYQADTYVLTITSLALVLVRQSFRLPYQCPSSSADCARELFKGSNGSASLVDCTPKKFWGWGMQIFCEWRYKWSSFGVILAHVAWPRAQPLGQSVLLKFSLETRLESESFEPLINFLTFLVQKLWSKINKLINYLIN